MEFNCAAAELRRLTRINAQPDTAKINNIVVNTLALYCCACTSTELRWSRCSMADIALHPWSLPNNASWWKSWTPCQGRIASVCGNLGFASPVAASMTVTVVPRMSPPTEASRTPCGNDTMMSVDPQAITACVQPDRDRELYKGMDGQEDCTLQTPCGFSARRALLRNRHVCVPERREFPRRVVTVSVS